MRGKSFALLGAGLAVSAVIVSNAYAAVYTLDSGDVASVGSGATDIATSVFKTVVALFPQFTPLIVVGLAFMLVMGLVGFFRHKRG